MIKAEELKVMYKVERRGGVHQATSVSLAGGAHWPIPLLMQVSLGHTLEC